MHACPTHKRYKLVLSLRQNFSFLDQHDTRLEDGKPALHGTSVKLLWSTRLQMHMLARMAELNLVVKNLVLQPYRSEIPDPESWVRGISLVPQGLPENCFEILCAYTRSRQHILENETQLCRYFDILNIYMH